MCLFAVAPLSAQETQVPFGGLSFDSALPVEVTADQLSVDQQDGAAIFSGNVLVVQGDMRLSSNVMRVEYGPQGTSGTQISRLLADGDVILINGKEAAEAREAIYTLADGHVVLIGDVLLTQGASVLSAQRMTIDLNAGTARMDGQVRTILNTGGN